MSQRGLEPPTFGLGNRCSILIELPRLLRRVRDLNPRNAHHVCRFSRPMQSATLPTLLFRAIRPTIAPLQYNQPFVAHDRPTIRWISVNGKEVLSIALPILSKVSIPRLAHHLGYTQFSIKNLHSPSKYGGSVNTCTTSAMCISKYA